MTQDPQMRIGITVTQCWHRVPGGSAVSVLALIEALASRADTEVYGYGASGKTPAAGFVPPVPTYQGPLPPTPLYESWKRFGVPRLRTKGQEVDLWHLTVPVVPPRTRLPLIATVHDVLPITHPEYFTSRGSNLMSIGLERIASSADHIAVPSQVVASECIEAGFDEDRLSVVPWGVEPVDPDLASADRASEVLARYGIGSKYVLFVGTLEPRKGLDTLVRAMSILDRHDVQLVVVGPEGWGDTNPQPSDQTILTGFVGQGDLSVLQSAAEICCVPSRNEGFGLPALEAMAHGTPVITTEGSAMAEVAGDTAKLVNAGEPTALSDAIQEVLEDHELAQQMSAAGLRRSATYSWDAAAKAMTEIYAGVLNGS